MRDLSLPYHIMSAREWTEQLAAFVVVGLPFGSICGGQQQQCNTHSVVSHEKQKQAIIEV